MKTQKVRIEESFDSGFQLFGLGYYWVLKRY